VEPDAILLAVGVLQQKKTIGRAQMKLAMRCKLAIFITAHLMLSQP
jgi:hypothetical protein